MIIIMMICSLILGLLYGMSGMEWNMLNVLGRNYRYHFIHVNVLY